RLPMLRVKASRESCRPARGLGAPSSRGSRNCIVIPIPGGQPARSPDEIRRARSVKRVRRLSREEEKVMAEQRTLTWEQVEWRTLEEHRDHDPRPYVRERCAALLKIAGGESAHSVAQHGLLKRRDPDTLYHWLALYQAEGLPGLIARQHGGPRRGCF